MIANEVLIAIISGICLVVSNWVSAKKNQKTMRTETLELLKANLDSKDSLLEQRLSSIEKMVEKHNNFMERVAILEANQRNIYNIIGTRKD